MPGSRPITKSMPAAMTEARGRLETCSKRSVPSDSSLVFFVTSTAAAVEMKSAGIWLTRPSPIVSLEYFSPASAIAMPFQVAIAMPQTMFSTVMISAAIASPRTNFEAPSMAP